MRVGAAVALLALLCFEIAESACDVSKLDAANPQDYCKAKLAAGSSLTTGDACVAHPEDLTPTQTGFGEIDAACERVNLEVLAAKKDGSLKAYLIGKPAPAVLGPGGGVFITDHHHLAHALLKSFLPYKQPSQHRAMYVCVTEDFSKSSLTGFWDQMKSKELVWLSDEKGNSVTPVQLPTSIKYLRDDPFRTLAEWSRDSYGFVKCGKKHADKHYPQCQGGEVSAKPFIEFKWANVYRHQFASENIYTEADQQQTSVFKGMLEKVLNFSLSADNQGLEGWNQKQSTDMISLDDHGCEAKSLISAVVV